MRRKTKQKQKKDYDRALFWLSRFTLIRFWAEPIHGHDHILLCSCTGKTTNWSPKATAAAVLKMPCPQSRAQMFMSSSNQSRQTCTLPQTKFHDQRSSRNPSRHQRSWSVRHRTYFISSALKLFDLKEKIQNTVRTHQLEAPQSSSQIQTHGCIIMVFKIWNDQECFQFRWWLRLLSFCGGREEHSCCLFWRLDLSSYDEFSARLGRCSEKLMTGFRAQEDRWVDWWMGEWTYVQTDKRWTNWREERMNW